jgi:hypothetical protein
MPTYFVLLLFWNDYDKLSPAEKALFLQARDEFMEDLRTMQGQRFRPSLRVKGVQGYPGVFEMTWAKDGRATFSFGPSQISGESHIIWRRIGNHSIFKNP